LWMYIQINTNPVVSKTFTVPINKYQTEELSENYDVSYPIKSVEIEIVGRANTLNKMTADDIIATIDYSGLTATDTGVVELPVTISSADNNVYFRVERQLPETVSVTVYAVN